MSRRPRPRPRGPARPVHQPHQNPAPGGYPPRGQYGAAPPVQGQPAPGQAPYQGHAGYQQPAPTYQQPGQPTYNHRPGRTAPGPVRQAPAPARPGPGGAPRQSFQRQAPPNRAQPAPQPTYGQPAGQYANQPVFSPNAQAAAPQVPILPPPQLLPPCKVLDTHPKTLAWCPTEEGKHLLVMGSNQKDLNEHFQSTISIEIVDTRLSTRGDQMPAQGSLQYDTCFSKLAWGQHEGLGKKGVVVGGMENGTLTFWDPTKIATSQKDALICVAKEPHTDCITDVDFNQKTSKYLVSSSIDGKVIVWTIDDLENIESQEVLGQRGQQNSPIMSVRWNKTTAFILAAGDNKGQIYILDLRRTNKVLMVIRSPSVGVTKNIAWHPANNMELAVCWKNGEAEMWDLANAMTPKATFHGETRSEFLTWCPHDHNLIAIAGADGVVRIYHTKREPNLIHHFLLGEANFILQWNPQHAGMLATSSVSGKLSVRTLNYTGPSHVPAWLQRKAGAQLAFGGKYSHFHPSDSDQALSTVHLDVVRADPVVVQRAQELQQALLDVRQKGVAVGDLIGSKVNTCTSADERTVWEMMSLYYNPEGLKAFKSYLGYSHQTVDPAQIQKHVPSKPEKKVDPTSTAFFDQLSEKNLLEASEKETENEDEPTGDRSSDSAEAPGSKGPSPMEEKIQNALVIADYSSAVELALKEGLFADALAFAHEAGKRGDQGEALWNRALKAYFTAHKNRFISQTLKRVVYGDLKELVQTSDLGSWKETIAIILTYGQADAASLIRALCDRLVTEGQDTFAAVQACICSGDCNRMADLLTKIASQEAGNQPESLHKSVEKLLFFASLRPLMQCALGGYEDVLQATFAAYVDMLTSNGAIVEAQYILGCTVDILRERGVAVGKDYTLMLQMLNEALGTANQRNQRMQQPDPRQVQHGQRGGQRVAGQRGGQRVAGQRAVGQRAGSQRAVRQPPHPTTQAPRMPATAPAPHHHPAPGGAPAFRTGVPGQAQRAAPSPVGRPRPKRPSASSRPLARPNSVPNRPLSTGPTGGAPSPVPGTPPAAPTTVKQQGFFGQNPVKKHHRRRSGAPVPAATASGQHGMAPGPHHSPRAVTAPQRPGMPQRPLSNPGGHAPQPGGYPPQQWQQAPGVPHHAQQAPMRPARPARAPRRPPR